MGKKEDLNLVKEFARNVAEKYPKIKIILFGSRAKGKVHKWSDFDLIIVSPEFRKMKSINRNYDLYDYWNYDYPVDFICYTPEEFEKLKNQISIVSNAIKEGIIIR